MSKTMWSVKCFGKHGGLIWEELFCTRDGARHAVDFCKAADGKICRMRYTIEKREVKA